MREFVTIHRGTGFGGGVTEIGEECFLMNYTHVITIGEYATVGGLSAIHQFVKVGDLAFISGLS